MPNHDTFPLALEPPPGAVTPLDRQLLERAVAMSRLSPRRRVILPLHKGHDAPLHRMLNAMQPGSYVRPHRHAAPPKAESVIVLQGRLGVVVFDDLGIPTDYLVAAPHALVFGVDFEPGIFHTFLALEPDTVLFEVKPGPYAKSTDKDFAPWAPEEYTDAAQDYLASLRERFRSLDG